ncbi:TorF family putative porin [Pseudomonas xantholysinigenes]|uniref:TorF family putative porin n=1 Tax=Pseudomonas xantholysinigenes TaxID=2745490 RepID=A0A9E6TVQ3_9PSED|nr:TorF family putative porin [Pseudomonas xantholysinigenes]QXI36396.1 TorF family putative porin [Pseudomonas xantholysinigenes]
MNLRNFIGGGLLACAPLANAIDLDVDFSLEAKIGVFSDYRTRGISQTQNDPALQGSLTLAHSTGLYAGVWSSNVDFGFGNSTRQELDYYAGYFWQVSDDVTLDTSYIKYVYPRQGNFNYGEYHAELRAWGVLLGGNYSDNFNGDQAMFYSYAGYAMQLPYDISLETRYGRNDYKDPSWFANDGSSRDAYHEWQVKLSRMMLSLDWSVSYIDTDLSQAECASYLGFNDICSATVVASVGKSF